MKAREIVTSLLGHAGLGRRLIGEASVHRPKRGRIYVASYTGPAGQVWKSTGTADPGKALAIAKDLEARARRQGVKSNGSPARRTIYNRRSETSVPDGMSQREVAFVLGLSERAVRNIEKRALRKLALHPLLRDLWREYEAGELTEKAEVLTTAEIGALLGMARGRAERAAILKFVAIVQA